MLAPYCKAAVIFPYCFRKGIAQPHPAQGSSTKPVISVTKAEDVVWAEYSGTEVKISLQNIRDVYDLKKAIHAEMSPNLDVWAAGDLVLDCRGTTLDSKQLISDVFPDG